MVRILLFLLSMLTANRPGRPAASWPQAGGAGSGQAGALLTDPGRPTPPGEPAQTEETVTFPGTSGGGWPGQPTRPLPGQPAAPLGPGSSYPATPGLSYPATPGPSYPAGPGPSHPAGPGRQGKRHRIPRWATWGGAAVVLGLIFRRAIASVVLAALSAALHLAGINVHLPSIRFAWPWQSISAGTTTNTDLGPWVLQKIEGISRPALGQANFSFVFTHKVSKNIGPWPCWYASTFYAVGHASATVDLNPGPAWWRAGTGHYLLRVISRPWQGKPGQVAISMVLPRPQLPQSVNDVTINNVPSRPLSTQHSWTYPGFGCGVLLRPQFAQSVLYSQAQQIAFYKATHLPQVTAALVRTAESQAVTTIRDNFLQPTVNSLGYTLSRFTVHWVAATPPRPRR